MNMFTSAFYFLRFYLQASTFHSIQSTYLYHLLSNTLEDERSYYAFDQIEKERIRFQNDDTILNIMDLGAGTKANHSNQRSISEITEISVLSKEEAQFLFRLVKWLKPQSTLELGTSLGLTSLYISKAYPKSEFVTVEGCPVIAAEAQKLFKRESSNIHLINDSFDNLIQEINMGKKQFNFIYLDGHHTESATLLYVESLLNHLSDPGLLMLDDIYWSKGMLKAWKELCKNENFQVSLDLFKKGILIKNSNFKEKQHFSVIKHKWKPWKLGLWG